MIPGRQGSWCYDGGAETWNVVVTKTTWQSINLEGTMQGNTDQMGVAGKMYHRYELNCLVDIRRLQTQPLPLPRAILTLCGINCSADMLEAKLSIASTAGAAVTGLETVFTTASPRPSPRPGP